MSISEILHFERIDHSSHAPWLVMIHGAGGSTATWKRQPTDFSDHFNLLLVDLPGHGQMAGKNQHEKDYSFEKISVKVWRVIDHLQIEAVHLVGISLGTIITQVMRNQRPDKVRSLINGGLIVKLTPALKVLSSTSLMLAKLIGYPAFYKLSAFIMLPRKNHRQSRTVFVRESRALSTEEFKKWTAMYKGLNRTLKDLFNTRHTTPHLIIMGDQDHFFLKSAIEYSENQNNVNLVVVPECGHVVSIEKAKYFNRVCIDFVKKDSSLT